VGFTSINCLSNSDTFVSLPFTRLPEFVGTVQSVSGNSIVVNGTPWTAGQFVYATGTQPKRYYALIGPAGTTNAKEGRTFFITGNSSNTLTLETTPDGLNGIPAGAQLLVIPSWTLKTVFAASDASVSFTATVSTRSFKTEILIPANDATGVNLAYSRVYFFSNNVNNSTGNVGWRALGDNTADRGDDPLAPDGYFVVRNLNAAPTLPLFSVGAVLTKKLSVPLTAPASGSQGQDKAVSMVRPVDVILANTGLSPADGSFVATTETNDFKDRLLVYNNAQVALNKAPSAVYFYSNNVNSTTSNIGWRLVGDNTTPRDNDVIAAGSGFTIRKAGNGIGQTVVWTNAPTY
jgi:uncharacterized protein (TIGR02597 family)